MTTPRFPALRRLARRLGWTLAVLLVVAAAVGAWGWTRVRASLAPLDGELRLAGLSQPVRVERDAHGVPTIRAANRTDVARALGFVHAQERFFQMDLLRRRAAGELAELAGPAVLPLDRDVRVHRFRAVARRTHAAASAEDRALVETYAAGVNAGLAALGEVPFEYLVLRQQPRPWAPEDTLLAGLAMFLDLQGEQWNDESARGVLHDTLPAALARFLDPPGTEWDAPLVDEMYPEPPLPGPEVADLRDAPKVVSSADPAPAPELGSNNWAVAGAHTTTGAAIVADDMHLGHAVPNVWFRASWIYPDAAGRERRITGVTLPGVPTMVVGSTGRVAWGFTNTEGDWADLVLIEPDPADARRYRTPDGPREFEHHTEVLHVAGGADETLDVRTTIWGPVVSSDHRGRARALRWTAYEPEAVTSGLLRLEDVENVDEALDVAATAGVPPQNFVCGDVSGRVGWGVIGRIPNRVGHDGRVPVSWADGSSRWDGWVPPERQPRVVDPPSGRVWSANSRVAGFAHAKILGEANYALGSRQKQIRDGLLGVEKASVADMLRIQLDDRALLLARWRDLLLAALTPDAIAKTPQRAEFRRLVDGWGGRAAVDSAGYRLVRQTRDRLARNVLAALTEPCRRADPRFDYVKSFRRYEGPLWTLLAQRPAHLLPAAYGSWDDAVLAAIDATAGELGALRPLAEATWGRRNVVQVRHNLSRALPVLASWLDMPAVELPGDMNLPRFQAPRAGASQRMAVSPGREPEGYFHMPAGQSGHPLSPFYADGHDAWVRGEPTPFLPGPTTHTLTLKP